MPRTVTTQRSSHPATPTPTKDAALHLTPRTLAWLADHPHARRPVNSVLDKLTELDRAGHCPGAIDALRRVLDPHQPTAAGRCRTCARTRGRRRPFPCLVWHQIHLGLLGVLASDSRHRPSTEGLESIMAGQPEIILVGILVEDPELRVTSGTAVAGFTVAAHDRYYDPATGHFTDNGTTLLRCSIRHPAAQNITESLTKGDRVMVTGVLRQREWDTTDGDQRYAYHVDATEVGASLTQATVTITKTTRDTTSPSADHRGHDKPPP